MTERTNEHPTRKAITVVALGVAGAGALGLTSCDSPAPSPDDYSRCAPIESINLQGEAKIRKTPAVSGANFLTYMPASDIPFTLKQSAGKNCIRIAGGFGGDPNGAWYGFGAKELPESMQEDVSSDPDGIVWVNEQGVEVTEGQS